MDCDRIAPLYQFFERAAFGSKLQKCRTTFLDAAHDARCALILGDGDGRFTQALCTRFPALNIHSVDCSVGMLRQARQRLPHSENIRLIHADASLYAFPEAAYDIVYSHFFFDCFHPDSLACLIPRIASALKPHAYWVVSDFRQAQSGWRRAFCWTWLRTMYLFFRFATGLEQQTLPDHMEALANSGFRLESELVSTSGLIAAECWRR